MTKTTSFWGSSTKVEKGEALGWRTFVSYLPPGGALCPWVTVGCRSVCLGRNAGRMVMKGPRAAQDRRARQLQALLHVGGVAAAARAYVEDLPKVVSSGQRAYTAVRVNGSSDLPLLADAVAAELVARRFAGRIYDYTKSLRAALAYAKGATQVHRTFSLNESNADEARQALAAGVNVAAVVEGGIASVEAARLALALGATGMLDGDAHDLRFLDPDERPSAGGAGVGWLVVLAPKGRARRDATGFVVRPGDSRLDNLDAAG